MPEFTDKPIRRRPPSQSIKTEAFDLPQPEYMPVPGHPDVYYRPMSHNFYDRATRMGKGIEFYNANIHLMR
jgi:hypothetical protein